MRLSFASLVISFLIGGCANNWTKSQNRWQLLQSRADGMAVWAQCIERRSQAYLDDHNPAPPPAWYHGKSKLNPRIIFTWVQSDCAEMMTGPTWESMPAEAYQQILGDAYQRFMSSYPVYTPANSDAEI